MHLSLLAPALALLYANVGAIPFGFLPDDTVLEVTLLKSFQDTSQPSSDGHTNDSGLPESNNRLDAAVAAKILEPAGVTSTTPENAPMAITVNAGSCWSSFSLFNDECLGCSAAAAGIASLLSTGNYANPDFQTSFTADVIVQDVGKFRVSSKRRSRSILSRFQPSFLGKSVPLRTLEFDDGPSPSTVVSEHRTSQKVDSDMTIPRTAAAASATGHRRSVAHPMHLRLGHLTGGKPANMTEGPGNFCTCEVTVSSSKGVDAWQDDDQSPKEDTGSFSNADGMTILFMGANPPSFNRGDKDVNAKVTGADESADAIGGDMSDRTITEGVVAAFTVRQFGT